MSRFASSAASRMSSALILFREPTSPEAQLTAERARADRGSPGAADGQMRCSSACCDTGSSSSPAGRRRAREQDQRRAHSACRRGRKARHSHLHQLARRLGQRRPGDLRRDAYVPNDVATYAMGMAASMGQFLLCAGTAGKRFAIAACPDHAASAARRNRRHGVGISGSRPSRSST